MQYLDKKRAFDMIPLAVDGELSSEKRRSFLDYIRHNPEIRMEYESHRKIKDLVRTRIRRTPAPPGLTEKVKQLIKLLDTESNHTDRL